jgi:hypothetical protein
VPERLVRLEHWKPYLDNCAPGVAGRHDRQLKKYLGRQAGSR